jgi:STE24 endopeptidase
MNVYAQIILAALLLEYALTVAANLFNLKALRSEPPDELRDVYDADVYARSQEYTRLETRFGFVTSTFDLGVLLAFWFGGGFQWLDAWVRGFGLGSTLTGLVYVGVLVLAKGILALPFSVYSTFVIEERFGFNRTTPRVFVLDLAKGLGLALVLGAPLLALVLLFFEQAGEAAWLYCWLASSLFVLFIQLVFPAWVLPLFNRFEPLPEGELREAISRYAESVSFALHGVFVMDGSRRSSRGNAFFTGLGKHRRVALYDTLLDKHTARELVAVLAHEIGHYKKKHIVKNLAIAVAHGGLMFYLLSIFLTHEGLFEAFYLETTSVYAGLVIFGLLYAPIELLLQMLMNLLMRRDEFEADRFAAETAEPEAMVSALKKLSADNLANLTPHPFYVFLNHCHPPTVERIRAIRGLGAAAQSW